jgi:hypothetical protein
LSGKHPQPLPFDPLLGRQFLAAFVLAAAPGTFGIACATHFEMFIPSFVCRREFRVIQTCLMFRLPRLTKRRRYSSLLELKRKVQFNATKAKGTSHESC